jgi:hypothetical protein
MVPRVLDRILVKHLDDAEQALERFEAGLSSPTMTLERLARGPEESLLANLDGLVIGAGHSVGALFVPALEARRPPAPRRVTVIALALLKGRRAELAVKALAHSSAAVRQAAVRACALAAGATLDDWIRQGLEHRTSKVPRATLLELAADRGLAAGDLGESLRSSDVAEVVLALRVAQSAPPAAYEGVVVELLGHADPRVRDGALVTALLHGLAPGWSACCARALEPRTPHPLAMTLLAGLGDRTQHRQLAGLVGYDRHRGAALRAIGYSGNTALVPLLLDHVASSDAAIAAIARDALGTLLGPEADRAASDDERATVGEWWAGAKGRYEASRRYLNGVPANRAAFAGALASSPTSRRYFLALLLAIQSGGAARVSTRAFTATQKGEIGALLARAPDEPWARVFSYF